MPNKPKPDNKPHMVRVHDDLWNAARAKAQAEGATISDVVRRALERYVRSKK